MKRRNLAKRHIQVSLAAMAGMLLTSPALAQSAPKAGDDGEIIVTARRVEERLQDVPISITVFNQEQLAARNITSAVDLAAYTPGLAVNGRYGSDKSTFVIRGFSQELNTLPTVGVYFADAVAPRLQSNIPSGNGATAGAMFDLQNVQVLKGPQGTLFGRNTTGGAILLVPRRPSDKLEGYVEGTVGNYNQRRVQAVLNLPLGEGFKIRLGVDRNLRDGYIRNRTTIGPSDFADINYTALRLAMLATLTPDLENYTIATYSSSNTTGTLAKFTYCNNGTPGTVGATGLAALLRTGICAQVSRKVLGGYGYYDVENNDPDPFVRSKHWQLINTTTWRASDTLTIKNIVSYGESRERYSFNLDGDNTAFPFVITYPGPARPQGAQSTLTEEFQLQGRSGDNRLTWQAGAYLERSAPLGSQEQYTQVLANCSSIYTFQCTTLSPFTSSVSVARNNYRFHNYGLYAQATFKLTERLGITAGIRNTWDWQRADADNVRVVPSAAGPLGATCSRAVTPSPNPGLATLLTTGVCTRSFEISSSRPTWLLDLEYKPTPDMLVFAKYARGYRGGGINEANLNAETWRPEKVDNYEIGFKNAWQGRLSGAFAITGFWNDFRDQQTTITIPQCAPVRDANGNVTNGCTAPAPTGINGIQNIGKSRMRGVEIEGNLAYGPVRLDFGYAYLDAKVIGAGTPVCSTASFNCAQASFLTSGARLPFAPRNRITLTGTLALPLDEKLGKVSLGATFTHTDSQINSYSNASAFAAGAIPFDAGISPATNLLNLNLNWKDIAGTPIELSAFATNVTGAKYFVSLTNGLASLGGESVILGEPRIYGMRLKVRFGS